MVEHRPWNDIIAYAILTLGVFIVAFPVYLALIASTHDAATVVGDPQDHLRAHAVRGDAEASARGPPRGFDGM